MVISEACVKGDPENANLRALIEAAREKKTRIFTISSQDTLRAGDLRIKCLAPGKEPATPFDPNDSSIVLRLDAPGGFSAMFTGDISENTESLIADELSLVSYLKVAHHGSRTSTSADFLKKTRPDISVISVGEGNSYGHPTKEALQRLMHVKTVIYRTDKCGEVIVRFKKGVLKVSTVIPP
ncbi:MAG: hypothetical protein K6E49_05350 [Lachnospiraceae bacterium]|nr:hypothetical protein [Lachnospiraceae bacterium]